MCRVLLTLGWLLLALDLSAASPEGSGPSPVALSSPTPGQVRKVYVIPIREDIGAPLVYVVRRGVKRAIEDQAELLVLDMETNGGRVDKTEEIIQILNQFPGRTVTYVNRRAFSAGAFISFATQQIFMAPESVIGAAAPIIMAPGGGPQAVSETVEAKMTSACAAMVRASAEKNGHNVDVAEAMVRRSKALVIDGEELNQKGELLTLTSQAAQKRYGNPPKPLLSAGTYPSLDDLLTGIGFGGHRRIYVEPTGWEKVGSFLSSEIVSSILLVIGVLGIYLEFKAPGLGIPGVIGGCAFALYFLGGYLAGLSGAGWILLFILGLVAVVVELFFLPGTLVLGLAGAAMMILSIVMALVDAYPRPDGIWPALPERDALLRPLNTLLLAFLGAAGAVLALARLLPHTALYRAAGSHTASGQETEKHLSQRREGLLGREGITLSVLRPGGKAQFGEQICDVLSRGEMIGKGERVKVIGFSGMEALVERSS